MLLLSIHFPIGDWGLNGATVQAREQVELDEAVFWRVGDAVGLVIGAGDYGYQVGGCA